MKKERGNIFEKLVKFRIVFGAAALLPRQCQRTWTRFAVEFVLIRNIQWEGWWKSWKSTSSVSAIWWAANFINETMKAKWFIFTDEKIFTIKALHNRKNYHQMLKNGEKKTIAVKLITPSDFSVSIGICTTGKTSLVFIDPNVKINLANYQRCIFRDIMK